jgi:hypothetical protein
MMFITRTELEKAVAPLATHDQVERDLARLGERLSDKLNAMFWKILALLVAAGALQHILK